MNIKQNKKTIPVRGLNTVSLIKYCSEYLGISCIKA